MPRPSPFDYRELERRSSVSDVLGPPPSRPPSLQAWFNEWRERKGRESFGYAYALLSIVFCLTLAVVLLYAVTHLPPFGDPANPAQNEVSRKYLEEGIADTGAISVNAAMYFDYRAFDTLGETTVLFVALQAVMILMLTRERNIPTQENPYDERGGSRRNDIIQVCAYLLIPAIMVFGFYHILFGHLGAGGGFAGGSILGAGLILYASAFGTQRAKHFINGRMYSRIVFGCLLFYLIAKGFVFIAGANGLDFELPLGTPGMLFSGGLILPIDICVGIIVASSMYVIYILFSEGELG